MVCEQNSTNVQKQNKKSSFTFLITSIQTTETQYRDAVRFADTQK